MATKPLTYPGPQPTNKREMQEVNAPEMFQFADANSYIEGKLLAISPVEVKGKETTQYLIRTPNGGRFTFLATYDLVRKLGPDAIDHFVQVKYEGEDKTIKTQGSPMRKFKVLVSKEKEHANESF
jgi:hypothetical protein